MPKVETLILTTKRGDNNRRRTPPSYKNCVSNCFGEFYDTTGYIYNKSRFGLENYFNRIQHRYKRDLVEPNLDVETSLPKRRVVKKLIRKQPIYNRTLELNNNSKLPNSLHSENSLSSSEEDYSASSSASRKHYRKRVVIKKRRKKRPIQIVQPSSTRRRKTVVVTRKRLLHSSSVEVTPIITSLPILSTSSVVTSAAVAPDLPIESTLSVTPKVIISTDSSNPSTLSVLSANNSFGVTDNPVEEILDVQDPTNITKHVPDYEPFFPELSESLDDSVILLKTTVISSIEYQTSTVVQSRLRTYTFVVTRVSGDEQIVTSTTEVKPQLNTLTITESRTKFTTFTLLDLEETETLPFLPLTVDSSSLGTTTTHYTDTKADEDRIHEEARYNNLATRVMSNGVEVIVASDKSTLPGEPDVKRILPSSIYKPVTLKPSTLSDHMMMLLPQDSSNVESLSSSLHPNQFVTKTCLTTFTYLTTYLENGSTLISSHEQVVSNIATEERNSIKIIPTPSTGITLTQHPNLAVGTFLTTYTYFTTLIDGEQPLVVTSKHTVTNTVTAPDDYLSLLQPPKKASPVKDTNTYYSTIPLEKTLFEGQQSKVISTDQVVTQVVITESIPPKATSVMTSYIALDAENTDEHNSLTEYTTTDVVKTYYVTYTYFNTFLENGHTVVKTNVSTSSDIVTEKLYLHPKRTQFNSVINTSPIIKSDKKDKPDIKIENLEIHATKTYVTTFTYFTTLLQENKNQPISTVISSHTTEIENVVTETIGHDYFNKNFLTVLQDEIKQGRNTIVTVATLNDGQKFEVTAVSKESINPTKVLPIEKTQMVETAVSSIIIESSSPNVITGSTIIFFDEIDQLESSTTKATPTLSKLTKTTKTITKNQLNSLLSSEIVKKSQAVSAAKQTSKSQTKRHTNKQTRLPIASVKPATHHITATAVNPKLSSNKTNYQLADQKKKTANKIAKPSTDIPDLLGLGSINMNTLHALKPVINAMAGLITTNLKGNKRNDSFPSTPAPRYDVTLLDDSKTTSRIAFANDNQNRSPIYIPLGADDDGFEIAESQNIATIHINEWGDDTNKPHKDQVVIGKPTHESPLLNGGIPISPGQVITANSDVIVGKPGRIGPRIPSIPLNKENRDETPIDMKPPPIHQDTWPKRHNDKFVDHLPSASLKREKPEHEGKKDDYFGPPPPLLPPKVPLRPANFVRGEKHKTVERKRIPLQPHFYHESNRIPVNFQNVETPITQESQPLPQVVLPIQIPLEAATLILTKSVNNFNIQPSVLNEPIVLPEVIERSTGQPLLVNLQPSQVAFVNIPHNRTTALIYGGSTEPHRNGQYFDDPSPYPEPEFSGIENFHNGVPQYASVYDEKQLPNQKQVEGVIKVGTNVINNNPPIFSSGTPPQIRPTKPVNNIPNQNVNINAPPISFGMVHLGNDFNAHIINHGDIQFRPPPASYQVIHNVDHQNIIPHQQPHPLPPLQEGVTIDHGLLNSPENNIENLRPPSNEVLRPNQRPHIPFLPNKQRIRIKPNNLAMEYLTPPHISSRPEIPIRINPEFHQHQQHLRPHIPINFEHDFRVPIMSSHKNKFEMPPKLEPEVRPIIPSSVLSEYTKTTPLSIPLTPQDYGINVASHIPSTEEEVNNHKEDDMENEAGEVIQESNTRPLRPGQIPIEILKANLTDINIHSNVFKNKTKNHNEDYVLKVTSHDKGIITNYNKSPIQNPRPFEIVPVVRPENHQTNQVNHHEHTSFVYGNSQSNTIGNVENQQNNQIDFNNQNIYDENVNIITTKQPQYYYEGVDTVVTTSNKRRIPKPPSIYYQSHLDLEKNINRYNTLFTTSKPIASKVPNNNDIYGTSTTANLHTQSIGSVEVVTIRNNHLHRRPYVTSMPVNPLDVTSKPIINIYEYAHNFGSQTEKPFNESNIHHHHQMKISNTTYSFNNEDVIPTQIYGNTFSTEPNIVTSKSQIVPDLPNITPYESDMEIMKPPPPPPEPSSNMQPPRIEIHSPGGEIHRVPILNKKPSNYDLEGQASSQSPYTTKRTNNMLPPKTVSVEEVMGLSPPPPITTYRPLLQFTPNISTYKPIYSLEIDPIKTTISKPIHPYTFDTTTTVTAPPSRRRRPFTRRPVTRRTTTTTARPTILTRRPVYNWKDSTSSTEKNMLRNKTTTTEIPQHEPSETEQRETTVVPSSSTSLTTQPTMEVIIGNPNTNLATEQILPTTTKDYTPNTNTEIIGSEVSHSLENTPTTSTQVIHDILTTNLNTLPVTSSETATSSVDLVVPTLSKNFSAGIHHAGNEIKVVDDTVSTKNGNDTVFTRKPLATTSKENKIIIPTRYITHTKTSTVTITKTTVVKTLGGPPSTMTILVTKTEKSTVVDTVTEIHTLVKPTNIVETVTTTINQLPTTLYPPDVPYGNTYTSYPPITPTPTVESSIVSSTSTITTEIEDDLEEFIIHDTDPPPVKPNASIHIPSDNDSIFVVMTDKKNGEIIPVPEINEEDSYETQNRDDAPTNNEVNRVLLGGILIASPPSLKNPDVTLSGRHDKCAPECKASKNELCQKVEGIMRCVCRPGFARMFPDRPCKPTYTYSIKLGLERHGKEKLNYEEVLADNNSPEFTRLATITHEALDRMVMQSDLRDIYHGVHVHSYEPVLDDNGLINNFYLQLSDNTDEQRLKEIFKKYLRNNNYSLGGTDLYASKDFLDNLSAEDFDECTSSQFHDCSEYAHCFNLPGTYTCSCKEGYSDLSENSLFPGRICSAELIGCEKCHYHGTCYSKGDDQIICECFQWYTGENCHINLKVLLIALVTLGALLFALLLVCIILTCAKRKPHNPTHANGMSFMPQRLSTHNARRSTLDRRAMIQDTSSEGSQSDTNTLPYVAKKPKKIPKGALKKTTINLDVENGSNTLSFSDQKDRSLPVMIPRAKYHPAPPTSPHLNMESFAKRKASASSNETKLLSYLDAGPSPSKVDLKQKRSKSPTDSFRHDKVECRKISGGALVSAGFEVSATVGGGGAMGTIGTIGTTCGTEADRSENATLIQKISADLLSSTGTMSQFTTFRKSLVDNDIDDPLSNWLDIPPKLTTTVSEARSYDETTIQPPTKSYRNGYDSKPSSQHPNDEANTMAERDVGSTFLLPHTHLYKPDRGSDISGFDSL